MTALHNATIDETAAKLIAAEVAESLRDELQALTARLARADTRSSMTVAEVATRLGVTRSTVYAHWREWGGYKLGSGEKAPIRFDASKLPKHVGQGGDEAENRGPRTTRRRRSRKLKRALIVDAPRMVEPMEEIA
jgi:transposase-like protein